MIAFVRGILEEVSSDFIILDKEGLGIQIYTTLSVIKQLPTKGEEVKLHTHFHVKEDAMQLFGFLKKQEMELFKLLISVSGVGPKAGLSILSAMDADTLVFAILSEDIKTITKAQGIGSKIAKKIILEIKDKVGVLHERVIFSPAEEGKEEDNLQLYKSEAVEVLKALGYSATEAWKAVELLQIKDVTSSDEVVKLALKTMK